MRRHERIRKLLDLLRARRALGARALCEQLEASPATLKRDLAWLRDVQGAPARFDRERGGYVLDRQEIDFELPGLWFTAEQLQALLTLKHLVTQIDAGGLLAAHFAPLQDRIDQALEASGHAAPNVAARVRILSITARQLEPRHFRTVGQAVLDRRQLAVTYYNRERDERSERTVSPQRLVHYRDNWYLDAWCHARDALRTFSVDAIEAARLLDAAAIDIPDTHLDEELGAGYGIFSGRTVHWATLRFSPQKSRWVSAERWHSDQRGHWDEHRRWVLELPYSDPRELVMDILRHVPEVEVIGPPELRAEVNLRLQAGLASVDRPDE